MRVSYENKIDELTSTAITALTENALFPIENIQDQRLSNQYKTDSASIQSVIFDMGGATAISVAAILGHDLVSGQSVLIQGNASNSWGSPSFSTALTVTGSTETILNFFGGTASYQYWRFYFTSVTSTLSIGRLWLGEYITIDPSSLLEFTITKKRNDTVIYGRNRQKFSLAGCDTWRMFELTFPDSDYSMVKKIEDMFDSVGNYKSVIFCNFDTIRNYNIVEPCYCSINGPMSFRHSERMRFAYDLILEEDQ